MKLPPAADGKRCRLTARHYSERVLGTHRSAGDVSIKSFPERSGNLVGEEVERVLEPGEMEETKERKPSKSAYANFI